jgi:hypothetical protein
VHLLINLPVVFEPVRHATFNGYAANIFYFGFNKTQARVLISTCAHFNAPASAIVVIEITAQLRIVEITGVVTKAAFVINFQNIKVLGEAWQEFAQHGIAHYVFIIQARQHGGFVIKFMQADGRKTLAYLRINFFDN